MDVSKPLQALLPAVGTAVLSALARTNQPLTGREVARAAERSQPRVQEILDRLVDQGLVHQQRAGRAYVYTLNRDHLAAPAVEALADLRPQLFRRLRELIEGWEKQPVQASLFGSAARGDGTSESDIDIFLVRPSEVDADLPRWREQVDNLADAVQSWTGNHAGISEVSEDEIPRLRRNHPPVVDSLRKDAVELGGTSVRKLLSPG